MHEILTNPLVIAAVIGIISAIFGKKNKDEKRPPGTRPGNQAKSRIKNSRRKSISRKRKNCLPFQKRTL